MSHLIKNTKKKNYLFCRFQNPNTQIKIYQNTTLLHKSNLRTHLTPKWMPAAQMLPTVSSIAVQTAMSPPLFPSLLTLEAFPLPPPPLQFTWLSPPLWILFVVMIVLYCNSFVYRWDLTKTIMGVFFPVTFVI